jgi:hypothetical protein
VTTYRLFPVEESGQADRIPREFQAEDDGQALRLACERFKVTAFELWRSSDYMATFTRNPVSQHSDWIVVATP